jgi:hypothetical protein
MSSRQVDMYAWTKVRFRRVGTPAHALRPRLAIDGKLRGCDVVALKVDDVAPNNDAPRSISGTKKAFHFLPTS